MKEESLLCFNPCFIGCCYQTRSNVSEAGSLTVFQSLFYWMLLSDLIARVTMNCEVVILFQSLFYWMLLSDSQGGSTVAIVDSRFQSLFYWMLLSDHHPCFTGLVILVTGPVSILVLLDAAIRQ